MFKKIFFVLLVVFLGIGLIGCKNSQSDSDALIQFLKDNDGMVMVEAWGTITKVIPEQREITLQLYHSPTGTQSLSITMTPDAKMIRQTIKNNIVTEEVDLTIEQVQKSEIEIDVIILLEPKGDHWEGASLICYH